MAKKIFTGKEEKVGERWYEVTVMAENIEEANRKVYVGKRTAYGIVEAVRGRWIVEE